MVVAKPTPVLNEKIRDDIELPIIDLMAERSQVSKLIVKACQDFGFFKVVNHGVSQDVVARMEEQSWQFFSKPSSEKQTAGPPNPYGYGFKNIGFNGDVGEVEYLILKTNPPSPPPPPYTTVANNHPINFSSAVSSYVEAVRELACEILELMGEGLRVPDTSVFSKLIRDVESDSLLRLNHYPPLLRDRDTSPSSFHHHHHHHQSSSNRIGFGEHTDPQILTILKSNAVGGLQISVEEGIWVPVTPHPTAFFVNVGDVLQAMTNGRFLSVRHRAMAMVNSLESRMSMAYFASPPLRARIGPIPELITAQNPRLYRSFTWADYKKATYSLRLGEIRLNLFKLQSDE